MIERISLQAEIYDVMGYFRVNKVLQGHKLRYNISSTQPVTVIMNDRHHERVINDARWGLFPYWAPNAVNTTVNQIRQKGYLMELAKRNRCIVPCTGFYGRKMNSIEKDERAMHIVYPGKPLFGVAAIYDWFRNSQGQEVRVFTILTEEATGPLSSWQPNVPVVLQEDGIKDWLDSGNRSFDSVTAYLSGIEGYMLRAYPVTNNVYKDYESPECVRELEVDFA